MAIKEGDNLLNFVATLLVGTIFFLPLVFLFVWGVQRIRLAWKRRPRVAKLEHDSANDKAFEVAGSEVVSGILKPGVWAKALAGADGNGSKAKAAYIKARVRELGEALSPATGESKVAGGLPTRDPGLPPNPEKPTETRPKMDKPPESGGETTCPPVRESDERKKRETEQVGTNKLQEKPASVLPIVPLAINVEREVLLRPVAPKHGVRLLLIVALLFAVSGAVFVLKRTAQPRDSNPTFPEPGGFDKWEAEEQVKVEALKTRAENGEASAQDALGVGYEGRWLESNLRIQKNWPEAVRWYRKASEQGLASAQYHLGRM